MPSVILHDPHACLSFFALHLTKHLNFHHKNTLWVNSTYLCMQDLHSATTMQIHVGDTTAREKVVRKCCVPTLSNCPNTHGQTTAKEKVVKKGCVTTLSNFPNTHEHTTAKEKVARKCWVPTLSNVLVGTKKQNFWHKMDLKILDMYLVVPQCGGGPYT